MKIFIERTKEEKNFFFKGKAIELLNKLNLNSEEVILIKNNEIVTEDEMLNDEDDIKILSVISGG